VQAVATREIEARERMAWRLVSTFASRFPKH
jgi:hypothetical protein